MKVCGELVELCPCGLLLKLSLFESSLSCELLKLFSDIFVFSLNVMQIALPCIEIVLVLPAIISSIILLYYLSLLIKELGLFVFHFVLLLIHELATANISPPNALYF